MKNEINEAHEAFEENSSSDSKRKIVVPGEVIVKGEDYLPGEGTRREGESIVASKFGLAEEAGRVVKLIPIFGAFIPRRNNVIIGRVSDITHAGWLVDIDSASSSFLPIEESPRFINRNEMDQYLAVGDVISAKIWTVKGKGIDLTLKGKGLGKLENGFIFRIIPSRVPRVIGREGSMVNLIKERTGCNITVGQNGWIWVKGPSIEAEIKARKAIELVADKVYIMGLTEKVEEWFQENE
ncbi:MAG: exosome complex protein Rrp4 [Nanoarchaeota archaeon]|nr:exosome complex protein Rrp4 [Nanoarchaeota archaeon]MBU1051792.1 exosome complex protein Rrp4 [Nanoarchaeota archaeon]MBU1988786.1 exosome complex protein Rrp4 [Nanoarchaeota archaeon]